MEEDIVYLEEVIDLAKTPNVHLVIKEREIKALENLIKGYRELEEREIWSTATINGLKRDFIPKSKIKEKIEDLNDYKSEFCQRVINHNEHTLTEFVQNILKEIMEHK